LNTFSLPDWPVQLPPEGYSILPLELLGLLLLWSLAFGFLGRLRTCPPQATLSEPVAVSVIVPARNESQRLPQLLASLQTQQFAAAEVIVVDDNSSDATAELARRYGATVVSLDGLAEGWLGKPRACWMGAQQARGELLVFLDADTALEPSGLDRIVAAHARYGGLVSLQPYHRMQHAYERLSAFFSIILMGSIRSFTLAGDHIKPNGSFGPCMVCSRADYLRTGGHSLVRAEILDDVALAQHMARLGVPTHNFIGRGVVSFRMYPGGLRDLADGWTKNFARGAMSTDPWIFLMMAAWIGGSVAAVDAALGWPAEGLSTWVVAGVVTYSAYVLQLWWLLRKLGNFGVYPALLYPLALGFFILIFLRSLYLTLVCNSVTWKGRSISVRTRG